MPKNKSGIHFYNAIAEFYSFVILIESTVSTGQVINQVYARILELFQRKFIIFDGRCIIFLPVITETDGHISTWHFIMKDVNGFLEFDDGTVKKFHLFGL